MSMVCCVASDGFAQRKRQRTGKEPKAVKAVSQADIVGTIETVFAIGAETTGLQIDANGLRFELDLADNAKLNAQIEGLSKKDQAAHVCGELRQPMKNGQRGAILLPFERSEIYEQFKFPAIG